MPATAPCVPIVLTVAGSDSAAGAGIQADLKTCSALGGYAATALTAVTAQNTVGVTEVQALPGRLVAAQMDAVFCDLAVGAVKVGLLPTVEVVAAVADRLVHWHAVNVVLDPVMAASAGRDLRAEDTRPALLEKLCPLVSVLTPNVAEARALTGCGPILSEAELAAAGRELLRYGPRYVLCKGGHLAGPEAVDVLVSRDGAERFRAERQSAGNVHGTGCTLSAALAVHLARGWTASSSVAAAKRYLSAVLACSDGLHIGHGSGPLNHFAWTGA